MSRFSHFGPVVPARVWLPVNTDFSKLGRILGVTNNWSIILGRQSQQFSCQFPQKFAVPPGTQNLVWNLSQLQMLRLDSCRLPPATVCRPSELNYASLKFYSEKWQKLRPKMSIVSNLQTDSKHVFFSPHIAQKYLWLREINKMIKKTVCSSKYILEFC